MYREFQLRDCHELRVFVRMLDGSLLPRELMMSWREGTDYRERNAVMELREGSGVGSVGGRQR